MNVLLGIDRIAEATPWLVETSPWREDPLAIEEAIRGFFDSFNSMDYERCLAHVALCAEADRNKLIGLLRLARYYSGTVDIRLVTNITVNDCCGSAVVSAMIRGEATKEEVKLVKSGTGWKVLWESAMPQAADEAAGGGSRNGKRPNKK